jgi:hypothetical protein
MRKMTGADAGPGLSSVFGLPSAKALETTHPHELGQVPLL